MSTRSVRNTPRRAAVLVAVAVAMVAGCSAPSGQVTASMISPERPAASELAPDPGPGSGDFELPDFELPDLELPDLELPDLQIPGLGDLGDFGFDGLGECFELLFAYSQLIALGMFSGGSEQQLDEVLGELEQSLPPELSDELRIVAESLSEAAEGDPFEVGGPLSDPEFQRANEAITAWLTTECVEADGA